jgi:hypothetical protein
MALTERIRRLESQPCPRCAEARQCVVVRDDEPIPDEAGRCDWCGRTRPCKIVRITGDRLDTSPRCG